MKVLAHPTTWAAGLLSALILTSLVSITFNELSRVHPTPLKINILDKSLNLPTTGADLSERYHPGPEMHRLNELKTPASRIFLDAEGRPTVPTRDQRIATGTYLQSQTDMSATKTEPVIRKSPVKDGGEYARLDDLFRRASVATINTDGSIIITDQHEANNTHKNHDHAFIQISDASPQSHTHE